MHRKFLLLFGLVFASFVPSAAAQAPPETTRLDVSVKDVDATLEKTWFGMYAHGKKTGFLHTGLEKVTENGATFYRASQQAEMKLVALGAKGEIRIEETLIFAERSPFALVSGEYTSDDGKSRKRVSLAAKSKGYEATVTLGKLTQKSTLDDLNFTLADYVSTAVWLKKGPAKGDAITIAHFELGELRMSKLSLRLVGAKEITYEGAKLMVSELEKIEHHAGSSQESVIHCDRNGFVVSGRIAGFLEMRKESESDAKKTEFSEDLILANMVKLDRPIGDPRKVKGMTLKGKGKIYGLLPQTALQTIAPEGADGYVVKIGKGHGTKRKATAKEIEEGLEESATYPIKDEKVLELARNAIGAARTDQEKASRLCKFVHEYIKYEIVYLPKVHDILERKVGDCKSYALLFTCLARAVGLPAREATGYFYMGDEVKGFGGHAWNEVLIDGYWMPLDATLGDTDLVPFYICVGAGREGLENMGRTNGKMSFELVDVE
jgi:hypothetical protein